MPHQAFKQKYWLHVRLSRLYGSFSYVINDPKYHESILGTSIVPSATQLITKWTIFFYLRPLSNWYNIYVY